MRNWAIWKTKDRDKRVLFGMTLALPFLVLPIIIVALISGATIGEITLDGDISDWPGRYRLDLPPWQASLGTQLYGTYQDGHFVLAIVSPDIATGTNVTVWLNTDRDPSTGYQIWGWAGGAEYNVDFAVGSDPFLYTGDGAGQGVASGPLPCGVGLGAVEFAIPADLMAGTPTSANILADIGDTAYLPADYSQQPYTVEENGRPPRTNFAHRVGIVFSDTSARHFFDEFAYSQLVMAMQHQATMAGAPFDILTEDDLESVANLVNYDALVVPDFSHVPAAKLPAIDKALTAAVYAYQIGLVSAGNLLTNDENGDPFPGDSYSRQKSLVGVGPIAHLGPVASTVKAEDVSHPTMKGYQPGETILDYDTTWFSVFQAEDGALDSLMATHDVSGTLYPAALATRTGGRNVHFSNVQVMGDSNLAWSSLRWVLFGSATPVTLKIGRQESLFVARNDMDQSMYPDELDTVERPLLELITPWKQDYNFVGSYYINIGNDPNQGESTDWSVSGPLYQQYMALGNEIGTHSYTHPDYTSDLNAQQLDFEFRQSRDEIGANLGITVAGAAIPGNPETMTVDDTIMPWFTYVSGRFSGRGSGYPSAFGTLRPDIPGNYYCLNMQPDFTLIGFKKYTAAEAEAIWKAEVDALTSHGNTPILHWLWHDYGPTSGLAEGYSVEMFSNLLAKVHGEGGEFITGAELERRWSEFRSSGVETVQNGNLIGVDFSGPNFGAFALDVDTDQVIKNVSGWYAYSDRRIFLPQAPQPMTIELGITADRVTRIIELPMRARLLELTGDGTSLSFRFSGDGDVLVRLGDFGKKRPAARGADSYSVIGDIMTLSFSSNLVHDVSIRPDRGGGGGSSTDGGKGGGGGSTDGARGGGSGKGGKKVK